MLHTHHYRDVTRSNSSAESHNNPSYSAFSPYYISAMLISWTICLSRGIQNITADHKTTTNPITPRTRLHDLTNEREHVSVGSLFKQLRGLHRLLALSNRDTCRMRDVDPKKNQTGVYLINLSTTYRPSYSVSHFKKHGMPSPSNNSIVLIRLENLMDSVRPSLNRWTERLMEDSWSWLGHLFTHPHGTDRILLHPNQKQIFFHALRPNELGRETKCSGE